MIPNSLSVMRPGLSIELRLDKHRSITHESRRRGNAAGCFRNVNRMCVTPHRYRAINIKRSRGTWPVDTPPTTRTGTVALPVSMRRNHGHVCQLQRGQGRREHCRTTCWRRPRRSSKRPSAGAPRSARSASHCGGSAWTFTQPATTQRCVSPTRSAVVRDGSRFSNRGTGIAWPSQLPTSVYPPHLLAAKRTSGCWELPLESQLTKRSHK